MAHITKAILLTMEDWTIRPQTIDVGHVDDNTSIALRIATTGDLSGAVTCEWAFAGSKGLIPYISVGSDEVTVTLTAAQMPSQGVGQLQLSETWGDGSKRQSNVVSYRVRDAIKAGDSVPAADVSAFDAALTRYADLLEHAEVAAQMATEQAGKAAQSATDSKSSADASEQSATASASSAATASTKAGEAGASADSAKASADTATSKATNAASSAAAAAGSASTAASKATAAANSATSSASSASSASASATTSAAKASEASASASAAAASAKAAAASAEAADVAVGTDNIDAILTNVYGSDS